MRSASANALDSLARHHLAVGNTDRAGELWSEADALHTELGLPIERRERAAQEQDRATALDLLGPDRFGEHWAIGQTSATSTTS